MTAIATDPSTATISPSELIFHTGPEEPWHAFPKVPCRGTVGCFTADRAPDWDLFVVIDYDPTTKRIRAISPRLRVDGDGQVEMGQDKTCETFAGAQCTCPPPSQGDDFWCHCGADATNRKEYPNTFRVQTGQKYRVWTFSAEPRPWIYHCFVRKGDLEDLEAPSSVICCQTE